MRPTRDQLKQAMQAAERMHNSNVDPHHVAASLRYLQDRNKSLEELLGMVDRFIKFGMPERELSEMRRLVHRLREEEAREEAALQEADSEIDSSMLL